MKRWKNIAATVSIFVTMALLGPHVYAVLPCDFDEDDKCDKTDVLALVDQGDLIGGVVPSDPKFDLTGDGLANMGDLNQWFREAVDYDAPANHFGGDANLDGRVDRIDLNLLALNWQGTDKVWSEGDFTYDGSVDASDLMTIGINWQQVDSRDAAVPEPASLMLVCVAVYFAWIVARKNTTSLQVELVHFSKAVKPACSK